MKHITTLGRGNFTPDDDETNEQVCCCCGDEFDCWGGQYLDSGEDVHSHYEHGGPICEGCRDRLVCGHCGTELDAGETLVDFMCPACISSIAATGQSVRRAS